jgi:hypothetical protein
MFLAVVLLLFYRDVVFGGRTFLMEIGTMPSGRPYEYNGVQPGFEALDPAAIAFAGEPFNRFVSQSVRRGDFPLWNPYEGPAGGPLFADGQTAPLEPIQFFFFFAPARLWPYAIDIQLLIRYFIAGFFCYLFARRLKLGFFGSISAGLFFMLGGYFLLFGNLPQVKTETLLPAVLYGYERLSYPQDRKAPWLCSLLIGWGLVAGMPEAVFFSLFLGTLWYFSRSISSRDLLGNRFIALRSTLLRYVSFTVIGFLIAAVFLLPLLEFIAQAKSGHSAGAADLTFPSWLLTALIYQSPDSLFPHVRLGFLAFFALIYSTFNLKRWRDRRGYIVFFGLYVSAVFLVLFGFPYTNWILHLPVLTLIAVYKYAIPSVLFCCAMLIGVFIDQIGKDFLSSKITALTIVIILVLVIWLPSRADPSKAFGLFYLQKGISYGAFVLLGFLTLALLVLARVSSNLPDDAPPPRHFLQYLPGWLRTAHFTQFALMMFLLFEPFYWSGLVERPSRSDPFHVPPIVEYLRKDTDTEPFRIFASDRILIPDTSTAYRIADVRWLNALIPQRAYDFSTNLIAPDQAGIRFTGTEFPISDRMFDLLNVKYVLVNNYASPPLPAGCPRFSRGPDFAGNTLANQIVAQNADNPLLHEERLSINGSTKSAIFATAPTTFRLRLSVPSEPTKLIFSIGLDSHTLRPARGAGLNFRIDLSNSANETNIYSKYIDPGNDLCARQWFDGAADLAKWAGQDIVLSFSTSTGPSAASYWDFAYWASLQLMPTAADAGSESNVPIVSHYSQSYVDQNVLIYQNNHVMPRSFIVYGVLNATSFPASLTMISDPAFDLRNSAVVENLPSANIAAINGSGTGLKSVAARAQLINSGEMDIQANTQVPGLLIVTDQYYPGWQAWVDGKQVPIVAVDGIFKGVFLDKGSHMIRFVYKPLTFAVGAIISVISLLITTIFLALNSRPRPTGSS